MDNSRNQLEASLDAWGVRESDAPPPPMPRALREAVRARRNGPDPRRQMVILVGTAAAAAAIVVAAVVMSMGPAVPTMDPSVAHGSTHEPYAGGPLTPTLVALTRANAAFDPEHVRLPESDGATGPTEAPRPFTPRDAGALLEQL